MRDDAARPRIDFQDRAAARASHVKTTLAEFGVALRHTAMIPQSASARREMNGQNVEHIQHLPPEQYDRH